jgi:hypothetical protein
VNNVNQVGFGSSAAETLLISVLLGSYPPKWEIQD